MYKGTEREERMPCVRDSRKVTLGRFEGTIREVTYEVGEVGPSEIVKGFFFLTGKFRADPSQ